MIFRNVSVICEGPTELAFITELNKKYFNSREISLKPIQINKSNAMNGNVSIDRIIYWIQRAKYDVITTFVDYYGFKHQNNQSVENIELQIKEGAKKKFFIPYLQMHETEALWFSNIDVIKEVKNANTDQKIALDNILERYPNPEDINNSKETAPSKRLEHIFPDYQKTADGKMISEQLTIEEIKNKCPRFAHWLDEIEEIVNRLRGNNG